MLCSAGAHQRARARHSRLVVCVDGQAKVGELEDALVVIQDVLGLDVPVMNIDNGLIMIS